MEIKGFYGTNNACTIFVYDGWYCVEGSELVNRTGDQLEDGINVETLTDYDFFTASEPVESIEQLIEEINS